MAKRIKIKQIKSLIKTQQKHKRTVKALGFHRLNEVLEKNDTPQIRGMIRKVRHLVTVVETKD